MWSVIRWFIMRRWILSTSWLIDFSKSWEPWLINLCTVIISNWSEIFWSAFITYSKLSVCVKKNNNKKTALSFYLSSETSSKHQCSHRDTDSHISSLIDEEMEGKLHCPFWWMASFGRCADHVYLRVDPTCFPYHWFAWACSIVILWI